MTSSRAADRFHEGCGYGVRRAVPKSGAPLDEDSRVESGRRFRRTKNPGLSP